MHALRIKGVVRLADSVRLELTRPLSARRISELERHVGASLRQIDRILAEHGTMIEALPSPTRRAYSFLRGIDFDSLDGIAGADSRPRPRRSVSFPGLWMQWQAIVDTLARRDPPEPCRDAIRTTSDRIERIIEEEGITPADLSDRTRPARGWLAFFSDKENFRLYLAGVERAAPIFNTACANSRAFRPPALVRFVPMRGLYRLRLTRNGTTVALPTPMCAFSDAMMKRLAEFALTTGRYRQAIIEATFADEYQAVRAEIESLGGVVEDTAGVHRNLDDVFRRVNHAYFAGAMSRPRLTWSTVFTRRKFGHYDLVRDTVMVSKTLDDATVPEFVIDFVMYHELLHKRLGVRWQRGRLMAHTAEFRRAEKRFRGFAEAEASLRRLSQQS